MLLFVRVLLCFLEMVDTPTYIDSLHTYICSNQMVYVDMHETILIGPAFGHDIGVLCCSNLSSSTVVTIRADSMVALFACCGQPEIQFL